MAQVQATLKARQADLEELACLVENSRMEQERTEYMEERRRKQKKRGFFGWLFGIGTSQDEMDMHQERMRDLSRSTLLHALQTERNNVDELEAALMVLQQNNSAISDMVKSRDDLINELNDRVAVFEEDKIVLKAALRQLQKEMKEEAPKTQKLVTDLDSSKAGKKNMRT
jgi:chromosome segregation ATPase